MLVKEWWMWKRSADWLVYWVRELIGADRDYEISYRRGGVSSVNYTTRKVVVDPTLVNHWHGEKWLPCLWRGKTVRDLPGLQWRVSRAVARHEAGHILETGPYRIVGQLHGEVCNALEDQRMEWRTGRRHRGARADFRSLSALLARYWPIPFLSKLSQADVQLNACLYWRWASVSPPTFDERFPFHNEAGREFWLREIRPLVEEAWIAPDAPRVSEIALEILRRLGLPEREGTRGHLLMAPHGGIAALISPESRSESDRLADPPQDDNSDNGECESSASGDERGGSEDAPGGYDVPASPLVAKDRRSGDEDDTEADGPPDIDVDESCGTLWPRPYLALERQVQGIRNRLHRVFASPTPEMGARLSSTGGTFSPPGYIQSQGEYPFYEEDEEEDDLRGTATVLLVDRTTSNGPPPYIDPDTGEPDDSFDDPRYRIPHARKAAMALHLLCSDTGMPLAIGYAGDDGVCEHSPHALNKHVPFSHPDNPVTWVRTFETPPLAEGPKALIAGWYGDCGCECVSQSLREAEQMLDGRSERRRLILYVHDGEPTDETEEEVAETVTRVRKSGIIVLGVYIGPAYGLERLQRIFGAPYTIYVEDVSKLDERLGSVLDRVKQGRLG